MITLQLVIVLAISIGIKNRSNGDFLTEGGRRTIEDFAVYALRSARSAANGEAVFRRRKKTAGLAES